jgi:hypothetical protein
MNAQPFNTDLGSQLTSTTASQGGRNLGRVSLAGGTGPKAWRTLAATVLYRAPEQHGWHKGAPNTRHSKARPTAQEDRERTPASAGADLLDDPIRPRRVRLMFQREARFGRMNGIKRCWAPAPCRPVVSNGYERRFAYVYGAVSPQEGQLAGRFGRE